MIRYQYKRQMHKRRTAQTSDTHTSTSTNVGPVQTSDWYKRQTSANVGQVHLQEKTSDLVDFEWTIVLKNMNSTRSYSLIHISLQPAVVDLKYFKLLVFLFLVLFSSKDPRKLIISSFSLFTTAPPGQELFFL